MHNKKTKPLFIFCLISMAVVCFLSISILMRKKEAESIPDYRGQVKIMLADNDHMSAEKKVRYTDRDSDIVFLIHIEDGYFLQSTDYTNSNIKELDKNTYELTLKNLPTSRVVSCDIRKKPVTVNYDANGGTVNDSTGDTKSFTCTYDCTLRARPNTENGRDMIEREGYTLIGWNTKSDGSGVPIGLGSRVTVPDSGELTLYAQWMPWTDSEKFQYVVRDGNARITACEADADTLVIPEILGSYPVTAIAKGAFRNKEAKKIVFPDKLQIVDSKAFIDCALEELYMPDTIKEIRDDSFIGCEEFKTIHINAATSPRYTKTVRLSNYADKIDLLMEEDTRSRIIYFSGSSLWFNLNGKMAEESFHNTYKIINLGMNGFYSSIAQMEILQHFLKNGDIVVHTPEESSSQQLMKENTMTQTLYACLELNYDLFTYVDIRNLKEVFSSLCEFNRVREQMEELSYQDLPEKWCIDEYGGFALDIQSEGENISLKDAADIRPEDLTEEGFARLNSYYDMIHKITGNRVLVSYSAINLDGLPDNCTESVWNEYEERFALLLDEKNAALFGNIRDSVLRGDMFHASNFHLTTNGAKQWTEMFLKCQKKQMEEEGVWEDKSYEG